MNRTTEKQTYYMPVYEREGTRFVFVDRLHLFDTKRGAAVGALAHRMEKRDPTGETRFTGDVLEVQPDTKHPFALGHLGSHQIIIIAGPLLQEARLRRLARRAFQTA